MTPRQVIDDVTKETPGLVRGCALTLDESKGGSYVMWTTPICPENTVKLPVAETTRRKLSSQWKSFVAQRAKRGQ